MIGWCCACLACKTFIVVCRVNGNLNLSRAIGDLKYKGNAQLAPAEQIITAQPDIVKVCSFSISSPRYNHDNTNGILIAVHLLVRMTIFHSMRRPGDP